MKPTRFNNLASATLLLVMTAAAVPSTVSATPYDLSAGAKFDAAENSGITPWLFGGRDNFQLYSYTGGVMISSGVSESSHGAGDGGVSLWGNPVSIVVGAETGHGTFDVWSAAGYQTSGLTPPPAFRINTLNQTAAFNGLNVSVANGSLSVAGSLNLTGTTGTGIKLNGTSIFSLDSAGKVTYASNSPVSIGSSADSDSSAIGALTVAGGIGVGKDSHVNGIRIGRGAGDHNWNTAVGNNSIASNTTGSALTALGYNALAANTSGHSNTGIGASALSLNAGGLYNTGIGASSLRNLNGGSNNTALGAQSLHANVDGLNNLGVGARTGEFNTSGSSNTFVGTYAGRYQGTGTTSLTATNNSIYIGYDARGYSNSDSNSIVIGASAVGEGANTTVIGTSSTTKTRLHGETNASSLKVAGKTTLEGQVIISVPQGDILMGPYQ